MEEWGECTTGCCTNGMHCVRYSAKYYWFLCVSGDCPASWDCGAKPTTQVASTAATREAPAGPGIGMVLGIAGGALAAIAGCALFAHRVLKKRGSDSAHLEDSMSGATTPNGATTSNHKGDFAMDV